MTNKNKVVLSTSAVLIAAGSQFLPNPSEIVTGQPNIIIAVDGTCPRIDTFANSDPQRVTSPAAGTMREIGSWAVSFGVAACNQPLAGETVTVERDLKAQTVTVNVNREVPASQYAGSDGGAYSLSVKAIERRDGVSVFGASDVHINESARIAGVKPIPLFDLSSQVEKGSEWNVYTYERTRQHAGGESYNDTEAMPLYEAEHIAAYAGNVLTRFSAGDGTQFAPAGLHAQKR